MGNLTVNGIPTAPNVDATVLLVLDATMLVRKHWTHFVAANATGGRGGGPVDVDVRGGTVALVMNQAVDSVAVAPLPGAGRNGAGLPTAYVVVLPTSA